MSATSRNVRVVSTGVANIASVLAALRRAGAEPSLVDDPAQLDGAGHVVLPGVGAFGAGMQRLRQQGMDGALRRHVEAGRPLLAVCLGLQLLFARSAESPDVLGLGLLEGDIERFGGDVTVPQIGWNHVEADRGCRYLPSGYAYFANSYRLAELPTGCSGGYAQHGERFVAALERGQLLACQFHPELSGAYGAELIGRWLAEAAC